MTPAELEAIRKRDSGRDPRAMIIGQTLADRSALLAHVEDLLKVIAAADVFVAHGHPYNGACITDHYFEKQCDCGFEAYRAARAKLEEGR